MTRRGPRRRFDPITVVEAAYSVDRDMQTWLGRLARAVQPGLDRGYGAQAVAYSWEDPALLPQSLSVVGTPPGMEEYLATINRRAPAGSPAQLLGMPARLYTYREMATPLGYGDFFDDHPLGDLPPFEDWVAVLVREPGVSLLAGGFSPHRVALTDADRRRWHRLAVHVGAGLRLQLSLASAGLRAPEAILEPNGRCAHAEGPARPRSVREQLREAAKRVDRARGPLRRKDSMSALELWSGLVFGRWSLVDRFDSDGRRFVLALKNDPAYRDPRALTVRERQVANLVGAGYSNKETAYALGLTSSAVATHVSAVLRKLGLGRREEIAASLHGQDARVTTTEVGEETVAVGSRRLTVAPGTLGLTPAEADVAAGVLRGLSDAQIAASRGVSPRTVANQLRNVFRKLGVSSRAELVTRLERTEL